MTCARLFLLLSTLAALLLPATAAASEQFADMNLRQPTLKVNKKGQALVEYTTEQGLRRHVLMWGAVNANAPSREVTQVRFRRDFSGGLATYKRAVWKRFANACRRYDGPALAYFVAGCKAPDGSYWALQSWQRRLPLLGFDPWLAIQDDYELHLSHWSGPLPVLEAHVNWTYGLQFQGVFGRLSYLGQPVFGFSSSSEGNPRDRYSRNVYIDTFNSAYGPGWKRESGILTHQNTGTFCHSFVPGQKPFAGYPSQIPRPGGPRNPLPDQRDGPRRDAGADVGRPGPAELQRRRPEPHRGRGRGERRVRPRDGGRPHLPQRALAHARADDLALAGFLRAVERVVGPLEERDRVVLRA